jgi:threonine dehydrogenase-like Zn-dependent dehydrogenase
MTSATQRAVQLTGPDQLILNTSKAVHKPGPKQVLCKVEAVGLCFSDLKLLKQFTSHARKSEVLKGIDKAALAEIPSYIPGDKPGVPGHEVVVTVIEAGAAVKKAKVGGRYLVQTDYRWLPTANSNAAFGYNFEGALQEYVLMDERVITSPEGESMLIPASQKLSASAIALVEPWACVEDSYAVKERTTLKASSRMMVVADGKIDEKAFAAYIAKYGKGGRIMWAGCEPMQFDGFLSQKVATASMLADGGFDDVVYFGSDAAMAEKLFAKLAASGLINFVQCGGKFGRNLITPVGRVHYGNIRIIGTTGSNPGAAMAYIPATGEIRKGEKINVVGAAGPMGVMHVVRNVCQGIQDVIVYAGDLDEGRLALLTKIAAPMAKASGVKYVAYNPKAADAPSGFSMIVLMVPVAPLVAAAVKSAAKKGIINIFAGIPANVTGEIAVDDYIEKELYFIGTSGSVLEDMKVVLAKVENGKLDTNISVAAICGLEGAVDGIRAVEKQLVPGKIIVYPACKGLGLTRLDELAAKMPKVAAKLAGGLWNKEAEAELLKSFQ